MDVSQKLIILSNAAKYDASCASSGSRRSTGNGLGNTSVAGICHSWSDDGRCISLLKLLLTNYCLHDCAYCVSRVSNDTPRAAFSVSELVGLTLQFYRRNYIEGLFLSSGVWRSPDYTMECLLAVVRALREQHHFNGYIHLKAIPGASRDLIRRAGSYCDRLSVNIELPSEASLRTLAPGKRRDDILQPMNWIDDGIRERVETRRTRRKPPLFVPAGQSTQMIVGASPETDAHILRLSEALYQRYRLKRVYYSAYLPTVQDSRLPEPECPDLLREHRLYQADWLVRQYGFEAGELLTPEAAFLDRELDPKVVWALRHFERFPVDVNRAMPEMLLRVPGIGPVSARRIVAARRHGRLRVEDLGRIGVVMRRARFFIETGGERLREPRYRPEIIRRFLRGALPATRYTQCEFALE